MAHKKNTTIDKVVDEGILTFLFNKI